MQERFAAALCFGAIRVRDGAVLIVATNRNPRKALNAYKSRWQIECLFAHTKTRGFNMEDTRLTQPAKLSLLLALVALAMAWSLACAMLIKGHRDIPRENMVTGENPGSEPASTPSDTGSQHTQPAHSKTGTPSGNGCQITSNHPESCSVVFRPHRRFFATISMACTISQDSSVHTLRCLPHNPVIALREPGLEPGIREGGGVRVGRATVARLSEAIAKTRASATVRLVGAKNAEPSPPSRR